MASIGGFKIVVKEGVDSISLSTQYKERFYEGVVTKYQGLGNIENDYNVSFSLPDNLGFVKRCFDKERFHSILVEVEEDWIRMCFRFEHESFRFSYDVLLD
jgi:hypothetical protein